LEGFSLSPLWCMMDLKTATEYKCFLLLYQTGSSSLESENMLLVPLYIHTVGLQGNAVKGM
jgi:hypothetical protein